MSRIPHKKIVYPMILVVITALYSIPIERVYSSAYEIENTIDFFWGYQYSGVVSAPRLDVSSYATEVIRKAFGSDYSVSVFVEAGLQYDFSFGVHSPYRASLYLSSTSPRVQQSTSGYIFLEPENIYFDLSSLSKITMKVGVTLFWKGVQIAGGEYPLETLFSFSRRLYTDHESPLGIYHVSIKQELEEAVGKLLPKIEIVLGAIIGGVVSVPLDWDLELVFRNYVDATPRIGQGLLVSPTTMTFDQSVALPFAIIPQTGGPSSIIWDFSQRMSMGIDFYVKAKVVADLAVGVATSYESPWFSEKVLSSDLITLTRASQNVLSSQVTVPLPKLTTKVISIDSTVADTTLKFFVEDETGASITGADLDVSTRKTNYSSNDIGEGLYIVTVPTLELSSIQVYVSKSGYEACSATIGLGPEYLEEYNSLNSQYGSLQSSYDSLQTQCDTLRSDYNTINSSLTLLESEHNSLQSNYVSLESDYQNLQSHCNELETQLSMYPIIQFALYAFGGTTALFVSLTAYLLLKRKRPDS